MQEPIIDLKVLDTLKDVMAEDFDALIPVFYDSCREILASLKVAFSAEDSEGFLRQAHSLKSSCANLGCTRLRDMASQLEQQGKTGIFPASIAFIQPLEEEFACIQVELQLLLR